MKKILVTIIMLLAVSSAFGQEKVDNKTTVECDSMKLKATQQLSDIEKEYKSQFRYFNMAGQEVYEPEKYEGYYLIVVRTLPDGTCSAAKVYVTKKKH